MEADELRLFTDSLRQSADRLGDADTALRDLDWVSALTDDPRNATRAVFGVLGELNLASSAIDDLLAFALGMTPDPDRVVLLPPVGSRTPPATYNRAELTISGLASRRLATASRVSIVINGGEQTYLTTVSRDALDVRRIDGIDPEAAWHEVTGQTRISDLTAVRWKDAVTTGQLALAQQLTAASRRMLELARDHALSRTQFDRPVASFQAIRHKLAEALVAVEGAEAVLDAGWAEPTRFAATMAKTVSGTAANTVAKHAQQVLAGMGFTSEHPFHHYLKRTVLLDQLMGSSANLRSEVGRSVLESNEIPQLLPL